MAPLRGKLASSAANSGRPSGRVHRRALRTKPLIALFGPRPPAATPATPQPTPGNGSSRPTAGGADENASPEACPGDPGSGSDPGRSPPGRFFPGGGKTGHRASAVASVQASSPARSWWTRGWSLQRLLIDLGRQARQELAQRKPILRMRGFSRATAVPPPRQWLPWPSSRREPAARPLSSTPRLAVGSYRAIYCRPKVWRQGVEGPSGRSISRPAGFSVGIMSIRGALSHSCRVRLYCIDLFTEHGPLGRIVDLPAPLHRVPTLCGVTRLSTVSTWLIIASTSRSPIKRRTAQSPLASAWRKSWYSIEIAHFLSWTGPAWGMQFC